MTYLLYEFLLQCHEYYYRNVMNKGFYEMEYLLHE